MITALIALFVALGGVGYAAVSLPAGSVGNAQLRNNSVSYKKIVPGAVGIVRANTGQLQVRVSGTCGSGRAIGSIDRAGSVGCNSALPAQQGTSNTISNLTGLTTVNNLALSHSGSYLALANPTATVSGGAPGTNITVICTLTLGSGTQTRGVTIPTPASGTSVASIPLQLSGNSNSTSVSCLRSSDPAATVSVTSALNALQTAS